MAPKQVLAFVFGIVRNVDSFLAALRPSYMTMYLRDRPDKTGTMCYNFEAETADKLAMSPIHSISVTLGPQVLALGRVTTRVPVSKSLV